MAYHYDVHHVPAERFGHNDEVLRLRFLDEGNDLLASVSTKLEELVIDVKLKQKGMATYQLNQQSIKKKEFGRRNNCARSKKKRKKVQIA